MISSSSFLALSHLSLSSLDVDAWNVNSPKNDAFFSLCVCTRNFGIVPVGTLIYVLAVATLNSMVEPRCQDFLAYRQTDRFSDNFNRRAVSRDLIPTTILT